ncbi:MAG: hypothetical protein V4572_11385 [Bacteroidota bacterium]
MKRNYLIIILLFWNNLYLNAQAIDKSKKELNSSKSKSSKNTRKSNDSDSSHVDSDDVGFFIELFGYMALGAFKYGLIGDYNNEDHLHNNLNSHPFSLNGKGNYSRTDTLGTNNFRLDLEDHYLTGGGSINGNHLDVKIRPSKYFYFKTDYFELFEKNGFTNQTDRLSLCYFNLAYDRVRLDNFNLGWTIGASYVGSGVNKTGFSCGLNATYFLRQNISVSIDSKWSSINHNPVNSLELKGKYFRKNFFGSLSYERLKIASPVYNLIGIGGGIYF